jgi:hypothetical protein
VGGAFCGERICCFCITLCAENLERLSGGRGRHPPPPPPTPLTRVSRRAQGAGRRAQGAGRRAQGAGRPAFEQISIHSHQVTVYSTTRSKTELASHNIPYVKSTYVDYQ